MIPPAVLFLSLAVLGLHVLPGAIAKAAFDAVNVESRYD